MRLGNKIILFFIILFFLDKSFAEEKISSSPLMNLNQIKPSFEEESEENINSSESKDLKEKKNLHIRRIHPMQF